MLPHPRPGLTLRHPLQPHPSAAAGAFSIRKRESDAIALKGVPLWEFLINCDSGFPPIEIIASKFSGCYADVQITLWKQVDLFTISILATLFTLKSCSLPLVARAAKVNDSITFARLHSDVGWLSLSFLIHKMVLHGTKG